MGNLIKPFNVSRTTDDTDPALNIIYKDGSAAYTVDSNASGTSLQIVGGGVTTAFLYSTYTTFALLMAAVRAIDGWEKSTIIGTGANLTAGLLDNVGPIAGTQAGVTLYFDTSAALLRSITVGAEELNAGFGTAIWTDGTQPFVRDPSLNDTSRGQSGSIWNIQSQAFINYLNMRLTTTGPNVTITECDQFNDYGVLTFPAVSGTALNPITTGGTGPIYASQPGRRLVCQIAGTSTATSGLVTAIGGLQTPGQLLSTT